MTWLLGYTLRATIVLAAALAASALLGRCSAATRHLVLALGVAAALAVGPLLLVLPSVDVAMPWPAVLFGVVARGDAGVADGGRAERPGPPVRRGASGAIEGPERTDATASASVMWPSWRSLGFAAWVAGVVIGLVTLGGGLWRLARLARLAQPLDEGVWARALATLAPDGGVRRPVRLCIVEHAAGVVTWGFVRPVVAVPTRARGWAPACVEAVLRHELEHVRRGDWAVQGLARLLCAVLWFHPLAWIVGARLRQESERACDDAVLRSGIAADVYAKDLVTIARGMRAASSDAFVVAAARRSSLEGRIAAMLNGRLDRRRVPARIAAAMVVGALLLAAAIAGTRLSAQGGGTLSGHVYDPSGAVLPGVEVVLEDAQQVRWPTTTDRAGRFEFTPIGAGEYVLHVSIPGFKPLRDAFTIAPAARWSRDITMQVGQLQETITVRVARRAPAVAPSADRAAPVRVGGNIRVPVKLVHVSPIYPAEMRDLGLEGVVAMEAVIGTDGTVVSVRGASAQVHPAFARAAEAAVRQWRFRPTLLNGVPVEVSMTVSMTFGLDG